MADITVGSKCIKNVDSLTVEEVQAGVVLEYCGRLIDSGKEIIKAKNGLSIQVQTGKECNLGMVFFR